MKKSKFSKIIGAVFLLGAGNLAGQALAQEGAPPDHGDHHMPATAAPASAEVQRLYSEYCSVCHGDSGDGESRASGGLIPPPRDFTSLDSALTLTRERMIESISDGRPGTAMAGWSKRLSRQEIEALADHIQARFMPAASRETLTEGRKIFAEYCSVCHGDTGKGAVWAQNGLNPPPANFAAPGLADALSRQRMIFSVTYGRPQTAMSAWGKRLDEQQVEAVVDYVRLAFMEVSDKQPEVAVVDAVGVHDHDAHGADELNDPLPQGLEGNLEAGKGLYADNCVACHGAEGDGQGPRAYFIFPKPRDFGHPAARAMYSRAHLFEVISKGELGTEMPAWDKVLTDQEIGDLAEYVYTAFIRPEEAK